MLIGSQKDSKLEHGGALGRPRRPYDRPKVARPTWGMLQLCCGPLSNKGIWGSPKYFSKLGYQYYRQTTGQNDLCSKGSPKGFSEQQGLS